jgi:hypothetical protein
MTQASCQTITQTRRTSDNRMKVTSKVVAGTTGNHSMKIKRSSAGDIASLQHNNTSSTETMCPSEALSNLHEMVAKHQSTSRKPKLSFLSKLVLVPFVLAAAVAATCNGDDESGDSTSGIPKAILSYPWVRKESSSDTTTASIDVSNIDATQQRFRRRRINQEDQLSDVTNIKQFLEKVDDVSSGGNDKKLSAAEQEKMASMIIHGQQDANDMVRKRDSLANHLDSFMREQFPLKFELSDYELAALSMETTVPKNPSSPIKQPAAPTVNTPSLPVPTNVTPNQSPAQAPSVVKPDQVPVQVPNGPNSPNQQPANPASPSVPTTPSVPSPSTPTSPEQPAGNPADPTSPSAPNTPSVPSTPASPEQPVVNPDESPSAPGSPAVPTPSIDPALPLSPSQQQVPSTPSGTDGPSIMDDLPSGQQQSSIPSDQPNISESPTQTDDNGATVPSIGTPDNSPASTPSIDAPATSPAGTVQTIQPSIAIDGNSTTACTKLPRNQSILAFLTNVTDEKTLLDDTTPQGLAYLWISEGDKLKLDPCGSAAEQQKLKERYALVTFYCKSLSFCICCVLL